MLVQQTKNYKFQIIKIKGVGIKRIETQVWCWKCIYCLKYYSTKIIHFLGHHLDTIPDESGPNLDTVPDEPGHDLDTVPDDPHPVDLSENMV